MEKFFNLIQKESFRDLYNDPYVEIYWDHDGQRFFVRIDIKIDINNSIIDREHNSEEKKDFIKNLFEKIPDYDFDEHSYDSLKKSSNLIAWKEKLLPSFRYNFAITAKTLDECFEFINS